MIGEIEEDLICKKFKFNYLQVYIYMNYFYLDEMQEN